jgi:hypothetical protein
MRLDILFAIAVKAGNSVRPTAAKFDLKDLTAAGRYFSKYVLPLTLLKKAKAPRICKLRVNLQ